MYLAIHNINGYYTLFTYLHYFVPGRLKIHTDVYMVKLFEDNLDKLYKSTRRWLLKGERPYPGYCRAPGGTKCLPQLCNCKKLEEFWIEFCKKSTSKECTLNFVR